MASSIARQSGTKGALSCLFACGRVHRARVAVCAARAAGVDNFAPAPAVTAAPTPAVAYTAQALGRSTAPVVELFTPATAVSIAPTPTAECIPPAHAITAGRTGVGVHPASPAVTAAPVPVVKYIALAPDRSFCVSGGIHGASACCVCGDSSSVHSAPAPVAAYIAPVLAEPVAPASAMCASGGVHCHSTYRVCGDSFNRARSASACGRVHLMIPAVSVRQVKPCMQRQRHWLRTLREDCFVCLVCVPAATARAAAAPVAENISRCPPFSWRWHWTLYFARPALSALSAAPVAAARAALAPMAEYRSCTSSASCQRRCDDILFYLLLRAAETLRRHFPLSAVASSRDVAASLSQTAVAAAERCRAGPLCRALWTHETILEPEEEGRPEESHLTLVR